MGQKKYINGFKLALHEEELGRPYEWKKPATVFVNSMSDLFHEDIPIQFIQKVFTVMNETRHLTYQILTKRSDLLLKFHSKLNWTENIWMGVSVENEKVTRRISRLRQNSAHVKFLSLEPLIGPLPDLNLKNIHWVIVGGESGHHARPMKFEWAWDIKKQCDAAGVLFFFKQWGRPEFNKNPDDPTIDAGHPDHAKGGSRLNGRVYRAMPS